VKLCAVSVIVSVWFGVVFGASFATCTKSHSPVNYCIINIIAVIIIIVIVNVIKVVIICLGLFAGLSAELLE